MDIKYVIMIDWLFVCFCFLSAGHNMEHFSRNYYVFWFSGRRNRPFNLYLMHNIMLLVQAVLQSTVTLKNAYFNTFW